MIHICLRPRSDSGMPTGLGVLSKTYVPPEKPKKTSLLMTLTLVRPLLRSGTT